MEEPATKATYVRKTGRWKIYWMRADLKWHAYPTHPEATYWLGYGVLWERQSQVAIAGNAAFVTALQTAVGI